MTEQEPDESEYSLEMLELIRDFYNGGRPFELTDSQRDFLKSVNLTEAIEALRDEM
jgi:hypothetical protein